MAKKKIPFEFVGEALMRKNPFVRPMFGCHAYYIGEKIMLIVRDKEDHTDANGVWFATSKEHHEELRKILPSMTSVYILSDGKGETAWQMIPKDSDDFETEALRVCDLILRGDERIGKIPKGKRKKKDGGRTPEKSTGKRK